MKMQAIVQDEYGAPDDVLVLRDIDKPAIDDDEVLLRIQAAAVAGDDWHLVRGLPYIARMVTGLFKPKNRVPGRDVAGRVEAVGKHVTRFQQGDEVFGWCEGAFAEYAAVSENALALKPANLTLEQAAVVPVSAFTALQALRDEGRIQPGHKVLIIGASGGVGTFAVQIAKSFEAEVTGVCSTRNVDLVRSIGADRVIDYTREDFSQSGQRYDLILDLVGNRSLSDCRRALSPAGALVMVGSAGLATPGGSRLTGMDRWFMGVHRWVRALVLSLFVRQRLRPLVHTDNKEDLVFLKELIEAGKVMPVISARYPLSEVSEAIRHFQAGHACGKVVITV
jgi:NADPH:quinone reductase-like Zn-dependent oxidoreductase